MARILLGATGSVAAIRVPTLYEELKRAGHQTKVVATSAAVYFFDPASIDPLPSGNRNPDAVTLDEDEWPGRETGKRYQRDEPVMHIELRRWADLFLIAPLDANTLAKLANGTADNCLTCVWRAWDPARPVVLAPAMNTLMWENPLTRQHLLQLAELAGADSNEAPAPIDDLVRWINTRCTNLKLIAPQSKRLACGDVGVGAMAEVNELVEAVVAMRIDHAR
jgi:phosphopantothenoylcysteine decarboxylase